MSCIICSEESVAVMLDELNIAYLITDSDHCIRTSGKQFRSFAADYDFEAGISLYSCDIGVFDETEFRPLVESVFVSESCVKSVKIRLKGDGDHIRYLNAGFYPLSSCDSCRRFVLIKINDETADIKAYESIGELNRKLHNINEIISISASSTEPAGIIDAAVKKTVEILNFDAGAFYLLDSDKKSAEISAHFGLYDLYFPTLISPENKMYPFRSVYIEKKPVYAEQYLGAPHDEDELGVFTTGCVPVMAGSEVIGSLNIATSNFHKFTIPEKETVEALGRQIGGVIHLANLQKSLIAANDDANLYMDIMMHDINNANLISAGYLSLAGNSPGEEAVYAGKALCGVEQSMEIIKNVSVIRRLRETKDAFSRVSLDTVINKEISHFPDVNIRYNDCGMFVYADELLSAVFVNLLGNSVKFGGDDTIIDVTAVAKGDFVEVSVSDNGPGISDEIKPSVFNRFFKGKLNRGGRGLGLAIVKMVLERYESTVSAGDRIEGCYSCGAKFTFALKKA